MISWMQKNHKYMNIAMWIAVISFIGAGAIAGTNSFSAAASADAKVGDVVIPSRKVREEESRLFEILKRQNGPTYNREQAYKEGLKEKAINSLSPRAQILNLARQYGLTATDEERDNSIKAIQRFQVDGKFDMKTYLTFLKNTGRKPSEFESDIVEEITVAKFLKYISADPLDNEISSTGIFFNVSDKIGYRVIKKSDLKVDTKKEDLEKYWNEHKSEYMSKKQYKLAIVWTTLDDINIDDGELEKYYKDNSFNYRDNKGDIPAFDDVKKQVENDLRVKKGKTKALKERVAFKNQKMEATQEVILDIADEKLSQELWAKIESSNKGELLKPVAISGKYATVKVMEVIEPRELSFEEAKETVVKEYTLLERDRLAKKEAQEMLSKVDDIKLIPTEWITLKYSKPLEPMSKAETLLFLQKLFTSSAKNGIISTDSSEVVYKILDQTVEESPFDVNIKGLKQNSLLDSLIKELDKKNPVQTF